MKTERKAEYIFGSKIKEVIPILIFSVVTPYILWTYTNKK